MFKTFTVYRFSHCRLTTLTPGTRSSYLMINIDNALVRSLFLSDCLRLKVDQSACLEEYHLKSSNQEYFMLTYLSGLK